MEEKIFDVIVAGAGFAGLSAAYHLKKYGLEYVVFERGRIGESWRSQRWNSFKLNSTNKLNVLPGVNYNEDSADNFPSAPEFISSLERYVVSNQLNVSENSKIISVEKPGKFFEVTVSSNKTFTKYFCRQMLIASGVANEIKVPSFAKNLSTQIKQFHTSEYRDADQLPAGAVMVAGSAQSGCQIAEDLVASGRKVYLSTSLVGRIPRWYLGKDIFYWVIDAKFYDITAESIEDPKMLEVRPPQISGTGSGKDTVSLQSLAKKGVIILGKMDNVEGHHAFFQPNAATHVKFADEFSQKIKIMIDDFIDKNNLDAPAPHYDEADIPDSDASCASAITSLNLEETNITSIIWCTGFNVDFTYIKLPVFNGDGKLIHKDGITEVAGLYFLGYHWLRSRKSPILFGILEDADFITEKIYCYSKINFESSQVA